MNEHIKMLLDVGDEINISADEYEKWVNDYDKLKNYEQLEKLLFAVTQYLTSPSKATASVLASAIICTDMYIDNKFDEDF